MCLDVTKDNGVTIVQVSVGRLDIDAVATFRARLLSLIDAGDRRLVLDLGAVAFIDSSGLGALVSALKALKGSAGPGDLRLARVQPSVAALLEVIRLNRVFSTYATVEDAVQSFS